jgi:hypothetical protein
MEIAADTPTTLFKMPCSRGTECRRKIERRQHFRNYPSHMTLEIRLDQGRPGKLPVLRRMYCNTRCWSRSIVSATKRWR